MLSKSVLLDMVSPFPVVHCSVLLFPVLTLSSTFPTLCPEMPPLHDQFHSALSATCSNQNGSQFSLPLV